jgi:hypothetical protein
MKTQKIIGLLLGISTFCFISTIGINSVLGQSGSDTQELRPRQPSRPIPDSPIRDIAIECSSWQFSRTNGEVIARNIRLRSNGRITGYSHPNEAKWKIQNGQIAFLNTNNQITSLFGKPKFVNNRIVFISQSLGSFSHVLTCME